MCKECTALTLSEKALSNLRLWFQNEVLYGHKYKRNLLFSVILSIIYNQKKLNLCSCHLLEDILLLSIAPQNIRQNTWVKDVEFTADALDFEFKKMLLTAVFELLDYSPTKIMCEWIECGAGLSELLDLNVWSETENNLIQIHCLHLIPRLAKYLPQEVIKYDLLSKMFCRSGELNHMKDCNDAFFYLIQSTYSLSLNENLTVYFREKNFVSALIDYCETIVRMTSWTVRVQLVLQYTLNSIVNISSKLNTIQMKYYQPGQQASLSLNMLRRCINPREQDSLFDPCLIIAIVDFIWVIQIDGDNHRREFIRAGGFYLLLDVLEKESKKCSIGGSTTILLGLLSDLLEEELGVVQAVTWRAGNDTNLINMLCHVWRLAEKEKNVKRENNGCIGDCEAPLMGSAQVSAKMTPGSCIPILEMIGCLRPKIYSIITHLLKNDKDLVDIAEEIYSNTFRQISSHDKITLELIKHYEFLKEGEIWQNMLSCMKRTGSPPVAGDELLLHTLTMEHVKCARHVLHLQKLCSTKQARKELQEEKKLYDKIKASKITEDVDKYRAIEKDLLIKNNRMRLVMKELQISSIERSSYEWKKQAYLRTHNHKNSTTMMTMGRDIIASGKKTNVEKLKK